MTRQRMVGALAGVAVALVLASLYPFLTIDRNHLICGGIVGRIAITGAARSTNGELNPDLMRQIDSDRHRCQVKARRILVGAALTGALLGYTGAVVVARRRREPSADEESGKAGRGDPNRRRT